MKVAKVQMTSEVVWPGYAMKLEESGKGLESAHRMRIHLLKCIARLFKVLLALSVRHRTIALDLLLIPDLAALRPQQAVSTTQPLDPDLAARPPYQAIGKTNLSKLVVRAGM